VLICATQKLQMLTCATHDLCLNTTKNTYKLATQNSINYYFVDFRLEKIEESGAPDKQGAKLKAQMESCQRGCAGQSKKEFFNFPIRFGQSNSTGKGAQSLAADEAPACTKRVFPSVYEWLSVGFFVALGASKIEFAEELCSGPENNEFATRRTMRASSTRLESLIGIK
jgi:hypothetical protein